MTSKSEITHYFRTLPADRLDQNNGGYDVDEPCCVGSHLAHLLSEGDSYMDGAAAWAKLAGGNRAHAILILRECGAPHDPFGSAPWETPPAEVFALAEQVEELPSLRGADLSATELWGAHLSSADLRGADLRRTNLKIADLRGSDLSRADLRGADLWGAVLSSADLSGAYLEGADLRRANMRGAHLRYADLRRSDLSGADLRAAVLRGADLSGAVLEGAVLEGAVR